MLGFLRLYAHGIRLAFLTRLADRFDFIASLLVMLGIELTPTLITVLLYGQGLSFADWTLAQVILVQGVFLVGKGITFPIFAGMAWAVSEKVREGTFELLLLKPRHPLILCLVTAYDAEDLGKLAGGLVLMFFALGQTGLPALPDIALFLPLFFFGLVFFAAGLMLLTALLMIWVGNFRLYEIFDTVTALGQYPPVIWPKRIRQLALAPFPILGLAVLPASALLHKPVSGWPWAACSAVVLFFACLWVWNGTVKRLKTAGG